MIKKNLHPDKTMVTGKTLLITGGTGSFGKAFLRRFLDSGIGEIRRISEDSKEAG
jgi:UDP-N-acetylglucosamine 4,6-dehydratase/5-epimerase